MTITITIDTSHAAFNWDRASRSHTEVARIVSEVASRFDTDGPFDGPIYDRNGSEVGSVEVLA
jgi:hypothetical protein